MVSVTSSALLLSLFYDSWRRFGKVCLSWERLLSVGPIPLVRAQSYFWGESHQSQPFQIGAFLDQPDAVLCFLTLCSVLINRCSVLSLWSRQGYRPTVIQIVNRWCKNGVVLPILWKDCDFTFLVICKLLCSINLNARVFPDLRLSFNCWFTKNGSYKSMRVMHRCSSCFLQFALSGNFGCLARSEMYISKCGWAYTLGSSHCALRKGREQGIYHGRRGFCCLLYPHVVGQRLCFWENSGYEDMERFWCRTATTP